MGNGDEEALNQNTAGLNSFLQNKSHIKLYGTKRIIVTRILVKEYLEFQRFHRVTSGETSILRMR